MDLFTCEINLQFQVSSWWNNIEYLQHNNLGWRHVWQREMYCCSLDAAWEILNKNCNSRRGSTPSAPTVAPLPHSILHHQLKHLCQAENALGVHTLYLCQQVVLQTDLLLKTVKIGEHWDQLCNRRLDACLNRDWLAPYKNCIAAIDESQLYMFL